MNKIITIDLSAFDDTTITAFATWKNMGTPVDDAMAFLKNLYIVNPMMSDIASFNQAMASQQIQESIAQTVADAQSKIIIN